MKPRPVKCRKKRTTDPDVTWTRNLLIWSQTRWHSAAESMHKGFLSDKFLSWKNSKIMAKSMKRRMKNICRPLDLKIYIFNCSSQLSSSWVRRFANVPKVEEEIVVCIRVVRFTHKWRKWWNRWEKADYWYWEDLHTQKCVPNWDETALSNRFNAVKRAAFFLQRITAIHCNQDQLSVGKSEQLTQTWLECTTFWSGVRRATIAPRSRCTDLFWICFKTE